MTTAHCY